MTQITFQKSDFNDIYLPYIDNPRRFLVLYGGAGSGKSVFIAQRYLYRALKEDYFRLVYSRKIARTIRNSQFQLFKDLIIKSKLIPYFNIKEANMEIECMNGNMMIAAGLDDREKIKSIAEPTDIWCEEATEFDKEDIIQLNLRLRSNRASYNQVCLSFNPTSTENWIYDSFFVKKEFEADILKTTYLDNKFLPPEYKKELESLKQKDENYYNIYCLGNWGGVLKGLIYNHWDLIEEIPDGGEIIYGLDFGFNNPTSLIEVKIKDNHLYITEILYKSGMTNSDLIAFLRNTTIGRAVIYADSAEPQRIEELYKAGFNVKPADKSKNSVRKGIDTIKAHPLHVYSSSFNLLKEIRNYKWQEDKNGNFDDQDPVKFMDHAMDAMRYAIHTHLSKPSGKYAVGFA